jgi:hypothetical protein
MIVSIILAVNTEHVFSQNIKTIQGISAKDSINKDKFVTKSFHANMDSTTKNTDKVVSSIDSIKILSVNDSLLNKKNHRDWSRWRPSPQRALWLALVIPGAGQIYNRKYWKLPIVYGGIMGCIYAMRWNNMMYKDYSQAYLDIMDDDPTTASYNQFLHLGAKITSSNEERYKTIFKNRKDYYRRYRDLSLFCLIGVYVVSVIDAYVDAELSEFDISRDLSLKVEPTVIKNNITNNPLNSSAVGLQCSLHF